MSDARAPTTPIRMFISFSAKDEHFVQALRSHLSNLERQGELQVWTHQAILPGSSWEPEHLSHLQSAELVILLVSADFNASRFIQEQELAITLRRHRCGEVEVLPVFVRPADIEGHWIDDLMALPTDRKPVSSWSRADDAWMDVLKGIKKLLPLLRQRRAERSHRSQPVGSPAELEAELQEWRSIVERIVRLEASGASPEELEPLRQRAATLKRRVREGQQLAPGDILDERFTVLELIGQGGFARVWKAFDERDGVVVALKVLKGDFAQDRTHRERFEQGIRAMSRLDHPGIVRLIGGYRQEPGYLTSVGSSAGRYYYCAMEFFPGGDLQRYVKRHRPAAEWVLRLICAVAEGLEHAHARGCVHRDVKPGNILLTADLRPCLTDFDLVLMGDSSHGTRTGSVGTALYAAPEMHLSGATIDGRADVYGLAMTTLFGLYGAELPFGQMVSNRGRFLERLEISAGIRRVLMKALEVEPGDRYDSMRAYREALETVLEEAYVSGHHQSTAAVPVQEAERLYQARPEVLGSKRYSPSPSLEFRYQQVVRIPLEPGAELPESRPMGAILLDRVEADLPTSARPDQSEPAGLRDGMIRESSEEADPAVAPVGPPPRPGPSRRRFFVGTTVGILTLGTLVGTWGMGKWPLSDQPSPPPIYLAGAPPGPVSTPVSPHRELVVPLPRVSTGSPTAQLAAATALHGILINGGTFKMGSESGDSSEKPTHLVTLKGFRISKSEVTVAQYRACVDAKACTPPDTAKKDSSCNWGAPNREDHPINCVDWKQAVSFAKWVDGRLPTEAEWEYAARGEEGRAYPWGNETPTCSRAQLSGCEDGTARVCTKREGDTPEGLCDMGGNVWEWVQDCYKSTYDKTSPVGSAVNNCQGDNSDRVLRGGAWLNVADRLRAAYRLRSWAGSRVNSVGFRVVLGSVSAERDSIIGP